MKTHLNTRESQQTVSPENKSFTGLYVSEPFA